MPKKSDLECSTDHGIQLPRCNLKWPINGQATQYFRDTRKRKRGPTRGAPKAPNCPLYAQIVLREYICNHCRHQCEQSYWLQELLCWESCGQITGMISCAKARLPDWLCVQLYYQINTSTKTLVQTVLVHEQTNCTTKSSSRTNTKNSVIDNHSSLYHIAITRPNC